MTRFVDAVVIPVPSETLDAYQAIAERMGELWIEHGALAYFEGVETEPDDDHGPGQGFADLAGAGEDESVVVAYIVFESREHRDTVREAVMDDPAYGEQFGDEMPFDPSRMTAGSLTELVRYDA